MFCEDEGACKCQHMLFELFQIGIVKGFLDGPILSSGRFIRPRLLRHRLWMVEFLPAELAKNVDCQHRVRQQITVVPRICEDYSVVGQNGVNHVGKGKPSHAGTLRHWSCACRGASSRR